MSSWHQLRTVKEFQRDNMPMSTTSDEAAKCIDALADQYCGYAEDPQLGGFEGTFKRIYAADPNCVFARVVECAAQLIGTGTKVTDNAELRNVLTQLIDESNDEKSGMTTWERLHVRALQLFANGYIEAACDTWERILIDSPLDVLALRFAHDSYFYMSRAVQLRDSAARVFPHWNRHMRLYRHLFGMLSFGLVETHRYADAEKCAMEGLSYAPGDGWSTHSVAHVKEMTTQIESGAEFLLERKPLWSVASGLYVHLDWHYCLFRVEQGNYDQVLQVYDDSMVKRLYTPQCAILDIVDLTSLLYRLEMEGQNVGDRWQALADYCAKHANDHITLFNDAHFMMAFLGAGRHAQRDESLSTFREYLADNSDCISMKGIDETFKNQVLRQASACLSRTNVDLGNQIGQNLLGGLCSYANGDYDDAFEQLFPIRYAIDLSTFGGSHAQRDIFKQLIIHACLKSPKYRCSYGRSLLYERLGQRSASPLTQRLVARFESIESASS